MNFDNRKVVNLRNQRPLRVGDIVEVANRWPGIRLYRVALRVTTARCDEGTNAPRPGLYLFYGMWYGDSPSNINSYGKIEGLSRREKMCYIGHVSQFPLGELKRMLG